MSFDIIRYSSMDANTLLFQMVDDHDLEVIEQEVSYIREFSGDQDFCLTAANVLAITSAMNSSSIVMRKETIIGTAAKGHW